MFKTLTLIKYISYSKCLISLNIEGWLGYSFCHILKQNSRRDQISLRSELRLRVLVWSCRLHSEMGAIEEPFHENIGTSILRTLL